MATTLSRPDADTIVRAALRGFAEESELATLSEHESIRRALDLDSLDFLTFIERLSTARRARIEEDDYPRLSTIRSCVDFLTATP
ncbi:hypothetical protein NS506_04415 [Nocardia seriolae]|uniref:Acyl carrier protein n=1 Tax=Nocardia seriolae TaxID=37332 RepID=A0ABC8AWD9_9NOCA|nr:phosphopantetheine-binding protein [Nocardia seriolae]APA98463.1 hypothetical protein NS506_04415 [Nocardia seriolae]